MQVTIDSVRLNPKNQVEVVVSKGTISRTYILERPADLHLDRLKELIRKDVDRYLGLRARFTEIKNLEGQEIEV